MTPMLFSNLPSEIRRKQAEVVLWTQWYAAQDQIDSETLEGGLRDKNTIQYLQDRVTLKLWAIDALLKLLF